jgi:hypothetical protein
MKYCMSKATKVHHGFVIPKNKCLKKQPGNPDWQEPKVEAVVSLRWQAKWDK